MIGMVFAYCIAGVIYSERYRSNVPAAEKEIRGKYALPE
jgi:hypothetical protein